MTHRRFHNQFWMMLSLRYNKACYYFSNKRNGTLMPSSCLLVRSYLTAVASISSVVLGKLTGLPLLD